MRVWPLVLVLVALAGCRPQPTPRGPATFHVNRHAATCSDTESAGAEAQPYCTVKYAATLRQPGDTVLIHAGRYGEGPLNVTKSGTQAAPITWRGVGGRVVLGHFYDLDDATATPVASMPGVYAIPYTPISGKTSAGVFQTFFDPIVVDDDSNPTVFTMLDSDGPLKLKGVGSTADLKHEGTVRYENGAYLVHPYTNRTPSATATDFVLSFESGEVSASWQIFEDLTVSYTGAYNGLVSTGRDNVYRRIRYAGVNLLVKGERFHGEDLAVAHVIAMGNTFTFFDGGSGTAALVEGAGHTLTRTTAIHSWNTSIGLERATNTLIDGAILHGSPNHCGVGTVAATGTDNVIRNLAMWNCQDYAYWSSSSTDALGGLVLEHASWKSGVFLQSLDGVPVTGPITIRNSIFSGTVNFGASGTYNPALCQYESSMTIEHSVMASDATIHRCDTGKDHTIGYYVDACQKGELKGCMTLRDNRIIDPAAWATVFTDAKANGDTWNATLVAGSPAIGLAKPGATHDVLGVARPQDGSSDAGAYEFTPSQCLVSEWSAWQSGPWTEHGLATRTKDETRTRTITTPGPNCPPLTETRTLTETCTALDTTALASGGFTVTCSTWTPRP